MGRIVTLSGPRGIGKTTVIEKLRDDHGIMPIVPFATRPPRSGERDGIDYHFVSKSEFGELAASTPMFDVLETPSGIYGTPLKVLEQALDEGDDRTFNVATHTALQLREQLRARGAGFVRTTLLLPAAWSDIAIQMRQHGVPEDEIAARLAVEPTDLSLIPQFDQVVINRIGQLDRTVTDIVEYLGR